MKLTYKLLAIAIIVLSFAQANARQSQPQRVPATPYPIEVVQPDGEKLTVYLRGDERQHFYTTLDGYKIVKNKKGVFCFAKLNCKKQIVASKHRAYNAENRKPCTLRYLKKMDKKPQLKYVIQ